MMPRFGMELVVEPGLRADDVVRARARPRPTSTARSSASASTRRPCRREWVEYSRPQANGNKTDVRWVELTNDKGVGLRAEGMPLLSVEAHHASRRDIEQAAYTYQITQRPEVYLNLDFMQMGAGGIDSWSRQAYPMEPYRIPADKPYWYSFRAAADRREVDGRPSVPVVA